MSRNATQSGMKTANLPHGTMFTQIVLPPGKFLRISLDDLLDYFHNLLEEEEAILRNHLGRVYSVRELEEAGFNLSAEQKKAGVLQFCLAALPMGSLHSVDYAQD